ncbi:precorrin-2 C(20)-methyltransferase [Desulfuribacillus alkaliarsenatis]|uniref:Precorrin-2 C(20)-methyltransferase n=1 Tax=Desulfuribacillus alkaliarsenatis TaxID=766136 RepID=A0A1E5G4H5_9FIRM|nr:precorrin-2 C(20)-methyltransferase [Desulfuribacillus alkaliarsenatis]OEF97995.1 precorrin-2 C(20)-methyltransferase [Desulfuribacillus alkaliarsenatis]
MNGKLYGIGVGPGDPELLTLKAKRILEQVEVLLVPKSKMEKRSIALEIAKGAVDKDWQQVDLHMPMTADKAELIKSWQQAAKQIANILQEGKDAAFVTLGDPSLYSTFTYVMKHIKALAPEALIEIVPGISSINLMAATYQVPLAESEESVVIIPALKDKESLEQTINQFDNVVLLKAGNQIQKLSDILAELGQEKDFYYASRCGFADSYYTEDITELLDRKLDYLSTIIIKKKK